MVWVELSLSTKPIRIFRNRRAAYDCAAHWGSIIQMERSEAVGIIRHTIFVRSAGECEMCASPVNEKTGHLHEKLHRGQGGEISINNSIFICARCHRHYHRNREVKFTRRYS
jgi:5-methylcytosine-specific restriction endonuclease McrA